MERLWDCGHLALGGVKVHSRSGVVCLLAICGALLVAGNFCGCERKVNTEPVKTEKKATAAVVAVFNGSGEVGAARQIAQRLRRAGFDVGNGNGENAEAFEFPKTIVVDLEGRPDDAKALAEHLGVSWILQRSASRDRFADLNVIVGGDFRADEIQGAK